MCSIQSARVGYGEDIQGIGYRGREDPEKRIQRWNMI